MKSLGVDEWYLSQLDRLTGADDAYDKADEYLDSHPEEYDHWIASAYADDYAGDEWKTRWEYALANLEEVLAEISDTDRDKIVQQVMEDHFTIYPEDEYEG